MSLRMCARCIQCPSPFWRHLLWQQHVSTLVRRTLEAQQGLLHNKVWPWKYMSFRSIAANQSWSQIHKRMCFCVNIPRLHTSITKGTTGVPAGLSWIAGAGGMAHSTVSLSSETWGQLTGFGQESWTFPPSDSVLWAEIAPHAPPGKRSHTPWLSSHRG